MTTLTLRGRELVIEIEKVQRIRRTAGTRIAVCLECGSKREFVDLATIASLFDVPPSRFLDAIRGNACHVRITESGVQVCVSSILSLSPSGSFRAFTVQ